MRAPWVDAEPNVEKNNKFGIHLTQSNPEDIVRAADLVNANGGKWGYVTLVIQDNDRNLSKWQDIFGIMRELRLIPIVRLATRPEGGYWRRPTKEEVDEWVDFLNRLHWVVKDRYVILFNETNHAGEWGGVVNPESYAEVAEVYARKLKEKNRDFFVMPAGLDASAPSAAPNYEDEYWYIKRMVEAMGVDDFNNIFSGWSSHSYPNPSFAGSPYSSGRGTVRTYEWELAILKELGVKDLPVFITETGWDAGNVNRDQIAANFQAVFESVWLGDDRVVAVTPFVLNYPGEPFIRFSFLDADGSPFPQYSAIRKMRKSAGLPVVYNKGEVDYTLPKELVVDSTFRFKIQLKNDGLSVWDQDEYRLSVDDSTVFGVELGKVPRIGPGDQGEVEVVVNTNKNVRSGKGKFRLMRDVTVVAEGPIWHYSTVPLPRFEFKVGFYPKLKAEADDVEVQIFDSRERIVFKEKKVKIRKGVGVVEGVQNIAVGEQYRIVLLRSYYLPRQQHVTFQRGKNTAGFMMMFPLDFNGDGAWTLTDLVTVLKDLKKLSILIPTSR